MACYLIAQNGDSRKQVIVLAQTYFAVQTRKQEITEKEYSLLSEDEKRFYQRNLTRKGNYSLNQTAKEAGVKNFDKFHNAGYKGLYNRETADDIAKRKGLRYFCVSYFCLKKDNKLTPIGNCCMLYFRKKKSQKNVDINRAKW